MHLIGKLGLAMALAVTASVAPVEAGVTKYFYDRAGRLVRIVYPDCQQIRYVYDAAGNRVEVIVETAPVGDCTP